MGAESADTGDRGPGTEEVVLELLIRHRALIEGHFLLSSGLHSPRYLQCALALQHPSVAATLGSTLARRWRRTADRRVEAVVSPAVGGIVIGHEVGRALGVRAQFAEREESGMALRRGFGLADGEPVLVVEDVVTTGGSVREAMEAVRFAGGEVVGAACIADRGETTQIDGLPLVALVELEVPAYEPDACPLCERDEPLVKPGSRPTPDV